MAGTVYLTEMYPNFEIGHKTYGDCSVLIMGWGVDATAKIGDYCSFGSHACLLYGGDHRTEWVTTFPLINKTDSVISKGDIIIGNDVWIGHGAYVLSGVTVGDGAVIGCNAVVTKDVPPYTIVVGNPAEIVRKRFSDTVIQRLLAVRWWDFPDDEVMRLAPLLMSANIQECLTELENVRTGLEHDVDNDGEETP